MRCNTMAASYKKLFKLLIDRDMKKKELAEKAGISIATITKMGKDGAVVSSDVLVKICTALECKMDDILEIIPEKQ
nr:MAG TPA: Cro/C1-type HTH DNA-binding domain protein [Caudoviricetes sp.]